MNNNENKIPTTADFLNELLELKESLIENGDYVMPSIDRNIEWCNRLIERKKESDKIDKRLEKKYGNISDKEKISILHKAYKKDKLNGVTK
jgi:hypothetical protein